jgi:hypothetical protein
MKKPAPVYQGKGSTAHSADAIEQLSTEMSVTLTLDQWAMAIAFIREASADFREQGDAEIADYVRDVADFVHDTVESQIKEKIA